MASPSPTPWFPEELPWEPSANWREIETLLNCLKLWFQRRLASHTSLRHSNTRLQSCLNSLHLLYHSLLVMLLQAGMITAVLQKRNSSLADMGINTSSFSLQEPMLFPVGWPAFSGEYRNSMFIKKSFNIATPTLN